ncbi:unnamed protein product [Psylliodes chrysocephalus]|uniref:Uncharacterized protein n=1 Tax=Psylliodes chrysocephalus TaxID=3402493 RepID=A0A9P0D7U8_9CUCU|nr:unnamed protein product [Psylliodes chrysocephala]
MYNIRIEDIEDEGEELNSYSGFSVRHKLNVNHTSNYKQLREFIKIDKENMKEGEVSGLVFRDRNILNVTGKILVDTGAETTILSVEHGLQTDLIKVSSALSIFSVCWDLASIYKVLIDLYLHG